MYLNYIVLFLPPEYASLSFNVNINTGTAMQLQPFCFCKYSHDLHHKKTLAGDPVTTDLVSSGLHTCNTVKTLFAKHCCCNWSSGNHVT